MNIKHLFFCMLLIAFSSCSKPGYEKAIAEWVQTDSHGTWTDLKFELLEVLETEDVTVSDSLCYLNNKSAQLSAVIQKAESPRALFKPSFSAYMEAEKDGFFPIVSRHGKMYRQTKAGKQIIRA